MTTPNNDLTEIKDALNAIRDSLCTHFPPRDTNTHVPIDTYTVNTLLERLTRLKNWGYGNLPILLNTPDTTSNPTPARTAKVGTANKPKPIRSHYDLLDAERLLAFEPYKALFLS